MSTSLSPSLFTANFHSLSVICICSLVVQKLTAPSLQSYLHFVLSNFCFFNKPCGNVRRADSEAVLAWFRQRRTKRPMTSEPLVGRGENERTGYSRVAYAYEVECFLKDIAKGRANRYPHPPLLLNSHSAKISSVLKSEGFILWVEKIKFSKYMYV